MSDYPEKRWVLKPNVATGGVGQHVGTSPGQLNIPPLIHQILVNRGITTQEDVDRFFSPPEEAGYDPLLLPGMEAAVHRLHRAVQWGETIGLFGDFDVDGVSGTALLALGLEDLGAKVIPYLPHRVQEGHGLNLGAMQEFMQRGASLVVTIDCGVTSVKEVEAGKEMGLEVIITDHHTPPTQLPSAVSIVNPKLEGSIYPFPELSGAGLAYKLLQGLYIYLGRSFSKELAGLAVLGTVADLAPLMDENRSLAKMGLAELNRTNQPGLLALYRQAGIRSGDIDTEAISFKIAPRLNAPGRLEHASLSYRLLTTRSQEEADTLASRLEVLNQERQQLTEKAYNHAREAVMAFGEPPPLLALGEEWFSPGIAGLVASKLTEEFYRPAVVMSLDGEEVRASARSIPEFNIIAALTGCQELFQRYGGHHQAAGFVMAKRNIPPLKERLEAIAHEQLDGKELYSKINVDAEVSPASLMGETLGWLWKLEPCGQGNPQPVFLTRGFQVEEVRAVDDQSRHLRFKLKEKRVTWDAIAFRQGNNPAASAPRLDVVYSMGTQSFMGQRTLSLKVLDYRAAS